MQDFTYSVFSIVAIAIHLIINFNLLVGRGGSTARDTRYRGFLLGALAYYMTDATWGIFAGLGWVAPLYVDTVLFFLALVAFVFLWCRFVIVYLDLGRRTAGFLSLYGYALLALTLVALVYNPFRPCVFHIDAQGFYQTGFMRDPIFYLLVAFNVLMAIVALVKVLGSRDAVRRRSMMIFLSCNVLAVAILLQVIWPLTPFTSLGCLIGCCFFHIFVVERERDELRRAVLEREQTEKHADELKNALERARAAEKSRNMFFSIVSHDIRTPLNAILGYSELLQNGIESESERDEALKSIRASGTMLLHLVNNVLDLAKMDAGKMTLKPEPVRLVQLTDEVFSSFWRATSEKGVALVNRTDDIPMVLLDAHRFRQVLFNLVGNAVKFTERGSVTVSASYVGTNLEVSVSDTGCGIPPDMLRHVLDPFVQVQDPSHSADRAGGTGLGLSICRCLIETMGGELVVESELGKGSTFKARLSGILTSKEPVPAAEPVPVVALKALPQHVLVVDDSPVNRSVLTAHLRRAGISSVDHAGDGGEALAHLYSALKAGRPYDFVFSDFWMPNMNGLEFIVKLRDDSNFAKLPVFAVTADTEYSNDDRSKLFTGILLKPITYDKLVEVFAALDRV